MPIEEEFFFETGQFKNGLRYGIALNEYNGTYSIVSAIENQDGEIWLKFCRPTISKDKIQEKSVPMGVRLGTRNEAAEILKAMLEMLGAQKRGLSSLEDKYPGVDTPF